VQYEIAARLISFFTIFLAMACWELITPARTLIIKRSIRWRSNLSLLVFNTLILRLAMPFSAVWLASYCASNNLGLFNHLALPSSLEIVLCVLLFDLAIYWQHVLFHALPFLWRFHKVHHADIDFDVTTGNRFHTIEIILSMLFKFLLILMIGPSALAVVIFEIILNGMAMFNHSNIELPAKIDRYLRWIIVTPNMHRIHHSIEQKEHRRNFGFNISIWDKLFRTYLENAALDTKHMIIGLDEFNKANNQKLISMLKMPFASHQSNQTKL